MNCGYLYYKILNKSLKGYGSYIFIENLLRERKSHMCIYVNAEQ